MNQVAVEYVEVLQRSIQTADKDAWLNSRNSLIDNAMELVVETPRLSEAATELRSLCEGFRLALQNQSASSDKQTEKLRKDARTKAAEVASLLKIAEPSEKAKEAKLP